MRITQSMTDRTLLRELNGSLSELTESQKKLASEKKVTKPSDAPEQVQELLDVRAELAASAQYADNINSALLDLGQAESGVNAIYDLLADAKDIAVRGANVTGSDTVTGLTSRLEGVIENLLEEFNSSASGRYVFAGTGDGSAPFAAAEGADPDGTSRIQSVAYSGNSDVRRTRVSGSATAETGVSGAELDGEAVFASLVSLRQALASGSSTQAAQAELDAHMKRFDDIQARLGASSGRLAALKDRQSEDALLLEERRSGIEDTDLAEAAVEEAQKSAAYQATLAAVSKRAQLSLINYL